MLYRPEREGERNRKTEREREIGLDLDLGVLDAFSTTYNYYSKNKITKNKQQHNKSKATGLYDWVTKELFTKKKKKPCTNSVESIRCIISHSGQ
jgi:hypothetical protein